MSNENRTENADAWECLAAALGATEQWLIADPLHFAEFEIRKVPPSVRDVPRAELDFLDRPKKSGGRRTEIYPDVYTATFLEAMTVGLRRNRAHIATPQALQFLSSGGYDDWRNNVLRWVKNRIGSGFRVIMADIRDYFPSISDKLLKSALGRSPLSTEEQT